MELRRGFAQINNFVIHSSLEKAQSFYPSQVIFRLWDLHTSRL